MSRVSTSYFEVVVGGRPLPPGLSRTVAEIVLDQRLMVPAELSVALFGADPDDAGKAGITPGAEVGLTVIQGPKRTELFTGRIASIEVESSVAGQELRLRAYDALHQMTAGRRSQVFVQAKASDAMRKVLQAAGVRVKGVAATGPVFETILQRDESDYDFLTRLAVEAGMVVTVTGAGQVEVRAVPKASTGPQAAHGLKTAPEPQAITVGKTVISWRARVTQAEAVTQVVVGGWDPKAKQAVDEAAAPTKDLVANGAAVNGAGALHVAGPFTSAAEAKAVAAAVAEEVGSLRAELSAEVVGSPKVVAGAIVAFGKVGKPYDGRYVVTHATHRFGLDGYTTSVESTNLADRSLLGHLRGAVGEAAGERWAGAVVGIVTSAKDPDKRGRVKVTLPWLGDKVETGWARVVHHGAAAGRGMMIVPEVGDEVMVAFEHGDPDHPVVLGATFNGKDKPVPAWYEKDAPGAQVWRSVSGHEIQLRDQGTEKPITIRTGDGDVAITLHQKAVEVTTKRAPVTVDAGGAVTVTSKKDVTLEGMNVTIKARQNVTVEAQVGVKVKGTAQAELSSGGVMTVKGSLIKLN